jgi:bifunctional N-acetylglucosamine-1-phosphate-uridyltransferase/glucosamine-1-phosphate-acetyltransferase GlmU-like protein
MIKGAGVVIHPNTVFQGDYSIGNYSVIGEADNDNNVIVGTGIRIGSFCLLYSGSKIGDEVEVDDYCAIYPNATVGNRVKLLYGKNIYSNSRIGDDCIIGGNVPERMIIADKVTFMGEVAHSHYNPKSDWDTTDEPSPVVGTGSIIGVNALLIGGIKIGCDCYVSAGEILRHDLPDHSVFLKNQVYKITDFKGLFQTRY